MKSTVNIEYQAKANLTHKLCFISYVAEIIILFLLTHVLYPAGKSPNTVVFCILAIPLLPFFPFLIKRNIKAHAWLMFMTLFYFVLVVDDVLDPRYGFIAQLELANIFILFCSSMLFTRYEQKRLDITITPKDKLP